MASVERKVSRIGNSVGVTLPPESLRRIGVKQGDEVTLQIKEEAIIVTKSRKVELPPGISPDFFSKLKTQPRQDPASRSLAAPISPKNGTTVKARNELTSESPSHLLSYPCHHTSLLDRYGQTPDHLSSCLTLV
ncbi:MAG: AbrB/MazE/SpoVT family DNA-binding domain-containing protein [Firmicutes bacterium]|nr:AbrB/MazE/SpoVT family DNA-binding domain-containing protein [Bacillota bacterium]